jgi:hypothetical protein
LLLDLYAQWEMHMRDLNFANNLKGNRKPTGYFIRETVCILHRGARRLNYIALHALCPFDNRFKHTFHAIAVKFEATHVAMNHFGVVNYVQSTGQTIPEERMRIKGYWL